MICIQETKLNTLSNQKCYRLWGDNNIDWMHKEAEGGAGGILTMWHKNIFVYERHIISKGFLAIIGQHKEKNVPIIVVNVYSSCHLKEKLGMWDEIVTIRHLEVCKTWCILGNFNAVRKKEERRGVNIDGSNKKEISKFNKFIEKTEMFDIPLVDWKYTWYIPNGSAKSRIDRILTSFEWLEQWPGCKQHILDRQVSDHCAIVLRTSKVDWGPKPFRSLEVWNSEKGFSEFVKEQWNNDIVGGNGMVAVKEKFKRLNQDKDLE